MRILLTIVLTLSTQAFGITFQSIDKSEHGSIMFDLKLRAVNGKEFVDPTVDKALFQFGNTQIAFDSKDVFYKYSEYHKNIFVKTKTDFVSIKLEKTNTNVFHSTISHRSYKTNKLRVYQGKVLLNDRLDLILPSNLVGKR